MVKDVLCNGTGRLSKDVTEDIVKLEVGDSQTVLGAVLLSGEHVRELGAVAHQVAELPYFRRWDKAGLYHVAHEEVADPLCILAVGLITLLRLRIFGMGKCDETGFSRMLKTGIQYLPADSMQTSKQEYFASQSASSLKRLRSGPAYIRCVHWGQ